MRFDTRIDIGEGADRAGNGAGCNIGPGRFQPLTAASEFGVCFRHFETESHGFGMNAVAAADSRGPLVLKSAALDYVQQLVVIRKQYVRCAGELPGPTCVATFGVWPAPAHAAGGVPQHS